MTIAGQRARGDLEIDFRGGGGGAVRAVVVAGENGAGKTVVLEAIFAALSPQVLAASQGGACRAATQSRWRPTTTS